MRTSDVFANILFSFSSLVSVISFLSSLVGNVFFRGDVSKISDDFKETSYLSFGSTETKRKEIKKTSETKNSYLSSSKHKIKHFSSLRDFHQFLLSFVIEQSIHHG